MREIIIGRKEKEFKKFGMEGTVLVGKQYVTMGRNISLSNPVYLDISKAHVVFICGKRGGGKSYTMGVIAEGMADLPRHINQNLSFILLDTMGVYWTMKYPNKKDEDLLAEWGLRGKGLDVQIFTPTKYYHEYKEQGIPTDYPFAIKPSEMDATDWCNTFEVLETSPIGVLIERTVHALRRVKGDGYTIKDMIEMVQSDTRSEQTVKDAAENMFLGTESWGVFDENGTPLSDLARSGQVTILDVSCYATMPGGWKIKYMIVGLVAQKLFVQRMLARKQEEFKQVHETIHYFSAEDSSKDKLDMPLVWLVIDEAHEFLPKDRLDRNMATKPLMTIMREGRQPGISLILATQQPGKIHTDVMTQSDTVISHRITARMDVEALSLLTQSYMREGMALAIDHMPRVQGSAIVFDDSNEKLYSMQIRPRFTWHGGEAPVAVHKKKEIKY
ncbi:ATP-binding protein [Candidatus Woesearchaeota archaeon]|jgi:uncharacterized protein|nr:ATP-binding protein [Candidatus Woesearchaeota archaeon]MBT3538415.1 ATP-binding protein [Candidatus Woesearchaeota archaeon]MBT4696865.1 ATP-binding protein [Candidatus Woesearchaeota archaeon]MBT7106129.1 ATP-binding protein [Candidatus Woesearchaeota archaeon]MBT7930973.1 ATP-binding protein [Candidatus Woesearchaeota archaeon]